MINLSPSAILEFRKSPKHYYLKYILGIKETTASMDLGTLIHMALLEPEEFDKKYQSVPSEIKSFSAAELKEILLVTWGSEKPKLSGTKIELIERIREKNPEFTCYELIEENMIKEGKVCLSPSQKLAVDSIKESIEKYRPTTKNVIKNGKKEFYFEWQFSEQVLMRGCIDAFAKTNSFGAILDLKTTAYIQPHRVESEIVKNGIHIQMAIYADAVRALEGANVDDLCIITYAETAAPYCTYEYLMSPAMIDLGRSEYRYYVDRILECYENDSWPEPQTEIKTANPPDWYLTQAMEHESITGGF